MEVPQWDLLHIDKTHRLGPAQLPSCSALLVSTSGCISDAIVSNGLDLYVHSRCPYKNTKGVNFSVTRDCARAGFLDRLGQMARARPTAVPFVEWQAREYNYKSSETGGVPSS